jgi:hypothetical protein
LARPSKVNVAAAERRQRIIKESLVRARGGPHGILRVITEAEIEYLLEPALRELLGDDDDPR